MDWKQLEDHVRLIASCNWVTPTHPEHVNGVDVDGVAKVSRDRWVLVEISKESTLAKLREDLAKFATVRPHLFARNIYPECYFVSAEEPPPSLVEAGNGANVAVLSADAFGRLFLDYDAYRHLRSQKKFGSAVDPESGESDARSYVHVEYVDVSHGRRYNVTQLAQLLREGRKIILVGDYGTGKSRCVRELFQHVAQPSTPAIYPIAVDLRDQWGMKRAQEVVKRHCDDLGVGQVAEALVRLLDKGVVCPLLDGFDEIGSQTWSDNPTKLTQIRSESLRGVRDLLHGVTGGALITGREHYFNSDEEMFQCLGLDPSNTLLLRCADEFTEAEMHEYLAQHRLDVALPSWVPRRPLVCQLIARMDHKELATLSNSHTGEAAFWQVFVSALCERERRIHHALDPATIHRLIRRLARLTRDKPGDVGPISIEEMSAAFLAITGMHPVDESAVMLQRLSSLGRVASETTDRCFVDHYILDGLRAEDLGTIEDNEVAPVANEKWRNPLRRLGLTLLAADLSTSAHATQYHRLLKACCLRRNAVLAGDLVAGMALAADASLNFEGMSLSEAHIAHLDFSGKGVDGIALTNSVIECLDITDCRANGVTIKDCLVEQILGVTAAGGLPSWITDCAVGTFESVSTVARIRRTELSDEQRVFVTIVKKLFFQPGAGRQEDALLRGLGEACKRKSADRILNRLRADQIIARFQGKQGWVYTPVRKHASRIGRILMELTLSDDPLWKELRR